MVISKRRAPRLVGGVCAALLAVIGTGGVGVAPVQAQTEGLAALLAPKVTLTADTNATIFSGGASAYIFGTYSCSGLFSLPLEPQNYLRNEITADVRQVGATTGSTLVGATGRIAGDTVPCTGATRSYAVPALGNNLPLRAGPAEAVVRITACDIFGCTTATRFPTLQVK